MEQVSRKLASWDSFVLKEAEFKRRVDLLRRRMIFLVSFYLLFCVCFVSLVFTLSVPLFAGVPVVGAATVDEGLVGFWRFEEGGGLVAGDSSGLGNDGVLVNGPVWVSGRLGGGLQFDGSNDYVGCGNSNSLRGGLEDSFTMEAWVYNKESGTGLVRWR